MKQGYLIEKVASFAVFVEGVKHSPKDLADACFVRTMQKINPNVTIDLRPPADATVGLLVQEHWEIEKHRSHPPLDDGLTSTDRTRVFLEATKLRKYSYSYIRNTFSDWCGNPENFVKTVQTVLRIQNQIIHSLNQLIDHIQEFRENEG